MTYDPNDFQDQAALAAILQRQRLINAQNQQQSTPKNQQQSIPKNRQCPWCGGRLLGEYLKCAGCSSDIWWSRGKPFRPGSEEEKREKARVLEKEIDGKKICACARCKKMTKKANLTAISLLCDSCCEIVQTQKKMEKAKEHQEQQKDARKSTNFGCLIAFSLLVIPLFYFGSGDIAKGFSVILELGIGWSVFWFIVSVVIFNLIYEAYESFFCGVLSLLILLLFLSMMLSPMKS